jgi:hypothetical protein
MDTLFLTFANRSSDNLPSLREEDDALYRLLSPRARERHFLLHRDSFVTLENLPAYLALHRDDLVLFLFSGHAGRDRLLLGDGDARGAGLAKMLGMCPKLKLVVLNGCSTRGQVESLLENGVPAVVATSAPVDDRKAGYFSIRFFEALEQQFSIREAFEMAKNALEMAFDGVKIGQQRSIGFEPGTADEGAWGLYFSEKTEHHLDWKLPAQTVPDTESVPGFTPNQILIDTLFNALAPHSSEIEKLRRQSQSGMVVPLPKKRMEILNALPAPLAEPLRKLMVPVERENEGFDKVGPARLRQIARACDTAMELLGFVMLAQLWEAYYDRPALRLHDAQREVLRSFFRLSKTERDVFDFIPLIRTVRDVLDQNEISYFVEELAGMRDLLQSDEAFGEAFRFLNGLRLQIRQEDPDRAALAYLNKRAEESLACLYARLGFMARYRLATIQGIDVEKYRHRREAQYNHTAVMLHDLLGGFARSEVHLGQSMDNRSVLLIDQDNWRYLNLSPFVIDENAFFDRTDVCKLYFFSHYLGAANTFCFKYVNKPDEAPLEISDGHYPLVKEQFDAFADLILRQALQSP